MAGYGSSSHPAANGAVSKPARGRQKRVSALQKGLKAEPGSDSLADASSELHDAASPHRGDSAQVAVPTPPTEDHKPWKSALAYHHQAQHGLGEHRSLAGAVKSEPHGMSFPHPMTRSLPRSHKGEASKRKRVEASAGLRAQTPSPHPQSPPQGAPVTVSHPPIGPGPSGYKGGPLPPLGRPVTGGLNHHPFSLGSPASTFFSKPGQTSGTGAFTDLSKSSNRNGFHLVEPRFHPPPIPMKTEPGGNGVLPPSLLNSLEPRPISMLDALRQPVGPFPKLTKNCETHVHIARLIRYFMRQGKAAPEWAPGQPMPQPHMMATARFSPQQQQQQQQQQQATPAPPVITPTAQALPPSHPPQLQQASPGPSPAGPPTRVAASFPPNVPACRPERIDLQAPPTRVVQPPLPGHVQRYPAPFSVGSEHPPAGSQPLPMPQASASSFLPSSMPPIVQNHHVQHPAMNGCAMLPGGMPVLPPHLQQAFCQGFPEGAPDFLQSLPTFPRPGGAGQQQGWGPHSIHSPIVMGSLPPHLMPSGAIMGGNTVPRQRGRAGPPKPSRDRQEQEREMQQAAGRPLLGTPLPGGPRDGLLPQGHRSHSPDSKVVPGEPAGMLRPGPDQMGSPIHHMMPHTHQPSGTSTAPALQPLPHFNPMPSPYQGAPAPHTPCSGIGYTQHCLPLLVSPDQ